MDQIKLSCMHLGSQPLYNTLPSPRWLLVPKLVILSQTVQANVGAWHTKLHPWGPVPMSEGMMLRI